MKIFHKMICCSNAPRQTIKTIMNVSTCACGLLQTPALWLIHDSQYFQRRVLYVLKVMNVLERTPKISLLRLPHCSRGSIIAIIPFFIRNYTGIFFKTFSKEGKMAKINERTKRSDKKTFYEEEGLIYRNSCK